MTRNQQNFKRAIKLITIPFLALLLIYCSPKGAAEFETDELIGVWSGLLFQTESKYDSLVLSPAIAPTEAYLYEKGKETVRQITGKGRNFSFKDSSGLRFEGFLPSDSTNLHGVFTHDLWAQSLSFEHKDNQWSAKIHKPEIIDTDYIVYLEFYKDSTGNVQANIQSNKENRKLHFMIDEVLVEGNRIDFKITNDRFGISTVYDTEKRNIALTYGNAGGKIKIELKKLKPNELEGYLSKLPNKNYRYSIPEAPDSNLQSASLEDEDKMQWEHEDWVGYKLNLPMVHEPGDVFEYSSGGSNLLTGVIQKSVDTYLPLFIYKELLLPMDIHDFQMLTSPIDRGYLAGSFYMRPIDFAKFGLLVLNEGTWNGEQLIGESWINESIKPHIRGSWPKDSDYGYLWRLLEREVGGKRMRTIEAWGNGGQFLIIIPEIDMTITFTGGNYNLFPEMEDRPFSILTEYILPAVQLK